MSKKENHHRNDGNIITMCARKRKYGFNTSHRIAEEKGLRAYYCPVCNRYHLTSKRVA